MTEAESYLENYEDELKYLKLLLKKHKDINKACSEIINLKAILNLPKGTEHFVSDIHGEFNAFNHVIKNASGVIKSYIDEIFGTSLRIEEKNELATLIYYPEEKTESIQKKEENINDWYRINLFRLLIVCKRVSYKYTRSKIRKALPEDYAYIIEELITEDIDKPHKREYYNEIIDTILNLDRAKNFIVAISKVIQRLAIDHLHVIGDIYDRGEDAESVMDLLTNYHSVDIQWGNHDISWMGAAYGSDACIANVIRVSARYSNLDTLEEGYGINLVPLAAFAMETYKDDPCTQFRPKVYSKDVLKEKEYELTAKIHKAISIIQFKEEGKLIKKRKEYGMENLLLLDKIDYEKSTITIDGKEYELLDGNFPTVDPKNPFELSNEEAEVVEKIRNSFLKCNHLQSHAKFLIDKGSMYKIYNDNLLFHGCIPMEENGEFTKVTISGEKYAGKKLLDKFDTMVRKGVNSPFGSEKRENSIDTMWYLWCGKDSPLFGKEKITTFERYFIADKSMHVEKKDPYFEYRNEYDTFVKIAKDFNLDLEKSHIINGHVPVKVVKGESPVKANNKVIVIDGGFAKAYQSVTGIAGYTLISNSKGLNLVSHEPFVSAEEAIENNKDIISSISFIEKNKELIKVRNTDIGKELIEMIEDLEKLVEALKDGTVH